MSKFKDLIGNKFDKWTAIKYMGNAMWLCRCECGREKKIASHKLILKAYIPCKCTPVPDIHIGDKFGELTVLCISDKKDKGGHILYKCICSCGNIKYATKHNLLTYQVTSCGHKYDFRDLTGSVFGRWTVVSYAGIKNGISYWNCMCSCKDKTERDVSAANLIRGLSLSCGCRGKEILVKNTKTTGLSRTRFYKEWTDILRRCNDKNSKAYKNYGARGITVCSRWVESFYNFQDDMYESYLNHVAEFGKKNTTIDRIDVNGNYGPNNVRWATIKEQNNNRRNNHFITYNGETHTIAEWSDILSIPYDKLYYKLYKNSFNLTPIVEELHNDKEHYSD